MFDGGWGISRLVLEGGLVGLQVKYEEGGRSNQESRSREGGLVIKSVVRRNVDQLYD